MNQSKIVNSPGLACCLFLCTVGVASHACVGAADVLTYSDHNTKLLAAEGTTLVGSAGSQIGESIQVVGDIDGDGIDDMVLVDREYRRDNDEHQRGAIHIVYGGTVSGQTMPIEGARIELADAFLPRTIKVAKVGDMNGDGFADFVIGDPYGTMCGIGPAGSEDLKTGRVYVVYGRSERFDSVSQIGEIATTIRDTSPCTKAGWGLSGIGDLDGDGFADLAIATDMQSDGQPLGFGRLHLFYGSDQELTGTVTLQSSDAVLVAGSQSASFGYVVAMAGDVDGDGLDDFLVSQGETGIPTGESAAVFLVSGAQERLTGEVSLATIASRFVGPTIYSGEGVGDLDGDGFGDIAFSGISLVNIYYGKPEGFAATEFLEQSDATLHPRNPELGATFGIGAGDLDGDGHLDLIVGDGSLASTRGGAYVLYGSSYRMSGDIPMDEFGTTYVGQLQSLAEGGTVNSYGDWAGFSICVGDIDGDGLAEFGVGAPSYSGAVAGRVYLVSGEARVDVQL